MFTETEFRERFAQPEVVEPKEPLRMNLQRDIEAFLARGGYITEVPVGAKTVPNGVFVPVEGDSESGYPGITWKPEYNKWSVRSTNSRVHLGYAASLCEAFAMQEKHKAQQTWKEEGK